MAETDDSIEITAELPGVGEKDLDVSVEGDVLTIKGRREAAEWRTAWRTALRIVLLDC